MWKHNPFVVSRPFWTYAPGNNPDSRKSTISTRNAFAFFFDKNTHSNGPKLKINRGRIQSENRVYVTSWLINVTVIIIFPTANLEDIFEGLRQGTFSFVVLLRSSVCLKYPHWNTTDDERRRREKNEQKGFKGSSTGPPGEEIPRVPLRDLRGEKIKIFFLKKLRRAHTIEKNT